MQATPGVYQLHLRLPKAVRVRIGRLGVFRFPAGRYIYTGSALGGLERRLARHRRQETRLRFAVLSPVGDRNSLG